MGGGEPDITGAVLAGAAWTCEGDETSGLTVEPSPKCSQSEGPPYGPRAVE